MKFWSICASISVTITDIWTIFCTEHKYYIINTPEWPNSYKLKVQDGGGRHLEFRKNVNNSRLDKDILHQIIWEDAPRSCGDDHMTKTRNRLLIRVTSSNERMEHKYVDFSDYTDIWTKFYTELKHHTINMTDCAKFTWFDPRWWRLPSWISENVNNCELDRAICAKFGGQMHYGHAQMTPDQNSKPEVYLSSVIIMNDE